MSSDRLARIKERAEKATPGGWEWDEGDPGALMARFPDQDDPAVEALVNVGRVVRRVDAEFIAHARSDVPWLLAEVERLAAERDEARRSEALADAQRDEWRKIANEIEDDRDRAEAQVQRVRELYERRMEETRAGCSDAEESFLYDLSLVALDPEPPRQDAQDGRGAPEGASEGSRTSGVATGPQKGAQSIDPCGDHPTGLEHIGPCVRAANHDGAHVDQDGTNWTRTVV